MIIREMTIDVAVNFVLRYHYSKILPRLTKYYLGVYEDNELLGVITLGWGTQPLGTIRKLFPNHKLTTKDYLEIGKMCFDGIMGKCGYVYQASSMRYLGSFETQVYYDEKTHEKMHPRSVKTLLDENAKKVGKDHLCWLTQDFCEEKGISKIVGLMFRYIVPLNKKATKILNSYPEYSNLSYPKDKDLVFKKRVGNNKYVYISKPQFNMEEHSHNYQKNKIKDEQLSIFDML